MSKDNLNSKQADSLNVYDKPNRELQPSEATFSMKPMSLRGQKVSVKRSFRSILKGFSSPINFHLGSFACAILFLGSSFFSAWLLSLSFNKDAKTYCAFLSFLIIGFAIRYIKTTTGSLIYGFATGFFANIFIFSWIYDTVFGGTANNSLAIGALIGLSLILTIPFIFFSLFAWQYKQKTFLYPFASACAWVAFEILSQLIAYKWIGFPWAVLGYTQYNNLELIQISNILGVYGISFFIVFCSFSSSLVLSKGIQFKEKFLNILFIIIISVLFLGYGKKQLVANLGAENKLIKVAIVQPNTHEDMIEDKTLQVEQKLKDIVSTLQNSQHLDFVVWPESTLFGYIEEGSLRDFMSQASISTQSYQIAGGSSFVKEDSKKNQEENESDIKEYVSAGLYRQGKLVGKHYKRKLVPFGEFLPFQKYLKDFYEQNDISSLTGTFVEGEDTDEVLVLQKEEETFFGTQICFESIFPILWRLQAAKGAEFFVNMSNDGWFLNTAAPYQHLRLNVFRAVENNRPILRSANSGLSAYINNFGKIEYQSNLNEDDIKFVDLILPLNQNKTFYTKYGDIFGFLCLFLSFIFFYSCLDITQEND